VSDLRKAAEMALEALENSTDFVPVKTGLERETNNAIQALRQALAQPKREWDGLDEVEVTGMTCECVDDGTFNMSCAHDFARAIEAKLRERNT